MGMATVVDLDIVINMDMDIYSDLSIDFGIGTQTFDWTLDIKVL